MALSRGLGAGIPHPPPAWCFHTAQEPSQNPGLYLVPPADTKGQVLPLQDPGRAGWGAPTGTQDAIRESRFANGLSQLCLLQPSCSGHQHNGLCSTGTAHGGLAHQPWHSAASQWWLWCHNRIEQLPEVAKGEEGGAAMPWHPDDWQDPPRALHPAIPNNPSPGRGFCRAQPPQGSAEQQRHSCPWRGNII